MNKTTVNILVFLGVAVAIGLVIGVVAKAAKKAKVSITGPFKSGASSSSTNTGNGQMMGNLVDNNWNDLGGYMYQFPDGTQDYYLANDNYAGSSDKQGNWVPAA